MDILETIKIDGYKINIAKDDCTNNPFEAWDCEPPLITWDGDYFHTYQNAPENLSEFCRMLPDKAFARGERCRTLRLPGLDLKEFADRKKEWGYSDRDIFIEMLVEEYGQKPEGWSAAKTWFSCVETILDLAGISYNSTVSHGYSQGDSVRILALALPEWVQLVGAPEHTLEKQMESACNLYGAWAWGDVYGIASIEGPNGEELEDGQWGFYGNDHEKSGLLDAARDAIACHERQLAAAAVAAEHEAAEREAMACRDIVTV